MFIFQDDEDPTIREFKRREIASLQKSRSLWNNGAELTPAPSLPDISGNIKKRLSDILPYSFGAQCSKLSNLQPFSDLTVLQKKIEERRGSMTVLPDDGRDSDMSMSDSGRSDDEYATTSGNVRYVEDMLEDYRGANDLPYQEFTNLIVRVNSMRRDPPVGPDEEVARLLDCAYQLVIHRKDKTVRVNEFLKIICPVFEKCLLDDNVRDWTEAAHVSFIAFKMAFCFRSRFRFLMPKTRLSENYWCIHISPSARVLPLIPKFFQQSVWLLCALFMRLFATKLKFLDPNDPMMPHEYFHIAYIILSDKIAFHVFNEKSSARHLPVHFDDPGLLENCTIYNHASLSKGPGQQFKAHLYVFAKYDGFDHLKKVIETRLIFDFEPENFVSC